MKNLGEEAVNNRPPPQGKAGSIIEHHNLEKWETIQSVQLTLHGYIILDEEKRSLVDFQAVLGEATLVTPQGKPVVYRGMVRLVKEEQG